MPSQSTFHASNGTYNVCLIATNALGSDTVCKSLTVNTISGVGIEEEVLQSLVFCPNPTDGIGYIDIPESIVFKKIEVFNVLVEKQSVKKVVQPGLVELDLSKLASYSLEIEAQETMRGRRKFIVH